MLSNYCTLFVKYKYLNLENFEKAIELKRDYVSAYMSLAKVYENKANFNKAIEYYSIIVSMICFICNNKNIFRKNADLAEFYEAVFKFKLKKYAIKNRNAYY